MPGFTEGGPAAPCRLTLLAALPLEVRPFLRRSKARRLAGTGLPAWEFHLGEGRGTLALTGMGQDYAARAASRALSLWQPQALISLGFGGALLPGLGPGDLVLAASFWRYDPEQGSLAEVAAPRPPRPLSELVQHLEAGGLPGCAGSFVTTPGIIHKDRESEPLRHLRDPVLDLETAAVAAAAAAAKLPFLALRVITDGPGEEIPDFLREGWEPGYGPSLPTALGWLAKDLRRLLPMVRLWRRGNLGARRLAAALQVILPLF